MEGTYAGHNPFSRLSHTLAKFSHVGPLTDEEAGNRREQKMRVFLQTQAAWGSELLCKLVQGEAAGQLDRLNPSVLNSCQALAFVNSRKGGLGLTLASGYGFIIRKTNQDQYGNSTWSNPLFFKVSQTGIGFSGGYQHVQSVLALLTAGAIDLLKNGTTRMGTDLGLFSTDGAITGMSGGAALGSSQHLGINVDQDRSTFCYSLVDGAYLELSLHGSTITPDHNSNKTLYGELSADDILAGKAGPRAFDELLPLVRTINDLGRGAVGRANSGRPPSAASGKPPVPPTTEPN